MRPGVRRPELEGEEGEGRQGDEAEDSNRVRPQRAVGRDAAEAPSVAPEEEERRLAAEEGVPVPVSAVGTMPASSSKSRSSTPHTRLGFATSSASRSTTRRISWTTRAMRSSGHIFRRAEALAGYRFWLTHGVATGGHKIHRHGHF